MGIKEEVLALIERLETAPWKPLAHAATDAQIDALGKRLGLPIPHDLREWLLLCNPNPRNSFSFLGIHDDGGIEEVFSYHAPAWRALGWIPIATDGCGDPYVLVAKASTQTGTPVLFIDHEKGYNLPGYLVASSVWQFLRFRLKQEELEAEDNSWQFEEEDLDAADSPWPFDKEYVLALDPNLALYTGIRKGWEPETHFDELLQKVKSKEDLITFVIEMLRQIDTYPDEWRTVTMRDFLALVSTWLRDDIRFRKEQAKEPLEELSWHTLAYLLMDARAYGLEGRWLQE